ncbi:hypothetical protein [Culicoidibacter larvae]|uniref:Uncharacterized protein n=1 Tax=Culicoidibacter larvae TaxID=2579976 RepID=A0A5R8Q6P0_9FIRM|nr:hypothetical protein [Culicoidibacter larvae]TLG71079.1 hypothetical protein FEZ08_11755 [Culicoidibacter larvae]
MAHKYNFSLVHRQEPIYYIPVLKLEIKGRMAFILFAGSALVSGLAVFGLGSLIFNLMFGVAAGAITASGVGTVLYLLSSDRDNKTGASTMFLWINRIRRQRVIITEQHEYIRMQKPYYSKGVEMYGLPTKPVSTSKRHDRR